jgi:hypothetical protein
MDFKLYLDFREWEKIFEAIHYRGQIGFDNSIKYIIHSNEQGHNEPHLHAQYQNKEVSIGINTGKIIVGNLPSQKEKLACQWVLNHNELISNRWNELSNGIKIDVM